MVVNVHFIGRSVCSPYPQIIHRAIWSSYIGQIVVVCWSRCALYPAVLVAAVMQAL